MLKRTFETEEIEAKFWVDKNTGILSIDINGAIGGKFPHEEGLQIILEVKDDLLGYQESKGNIWDKFLGK